MSKSYNVDTRSHIDNDKFNIEYSQEVDSTLKSVKAERERNGGNHGVFKHAARIPQVEIMRWGMEDAGDPLVYLQGKHSRDPELAAKLVTRLNAREFEQLRIWQGRLAKSDVVKEANKFGVK